jgi:glycosyltransferase involved in cell wall biosynthesis
MQSLCRELDIGDRVVFTGEKKDISSWINALDLLIHPSRRESFGRVIVEALAREIPVVATRSGGSEEILEATEAGLLVPQQDPVALAEAMDRMISHPLRAREMAGRGRALVEEKFSLGRTSAALKEELERF